MHWRCYVFDLNFGKDGRNANLLKRKFVGKLGRWATDYDALEVKCTRDAKGEVVTVAIYPMRGRHKDLLAQAIFRKSGTCRVLRPCLHPVELDSWAEGAQLLLSIANNQALRDIDWAAKLNIVRMELYADLPRKKR